MSGGAAAEVALAAQSAHHRADRAPPMCLGALGDGLFYGRTAFTCRGS